MRISQATVDYLEEKIYCSNHTHATVGCAGELTCSGSGSGSRAPVLAHSGEGGSGGHRLPGTRDSTSASGTEPSGATVITSDLYVQLQVGRFPQVREPMIND